MIPTDQIICRGLEVECEIGFHNIEQGIQQKLLVDLEVDVPKPDPLDDPAALPFDYFTATTKIRNHLAGRRFNLIETVGNEIAALLLEQFLIPSVLVRITKFPKDMVEMASVEYICRRSRDLSL